MRLPGLALCVALVFASSPVFALTEWTNHKTASGAHPDAHEQQMMWLMNRARQNPTAEGVWLATSSDSDIASGRDYYGVNKTALRNEFAAIDPMPPAAFDVRLFRAARAHSQDMINRDAQDHTNQFTRISEEGFNFSRVRGNVFSYAWNALNAHAGFNIDWGPGTADGMQNPRGHRLAIMAIDGNYTNVGVAGLFENNARTSVGPWVVSSNYAQAQANGTDHFNTFIVGTVWEDTNGNDLYDVGEGISGVTVTPNVGDYFAVTASGGGYAIPITLNGQVSVTFSGGSILPWSVPVNINGESVLVDYETSQPSGGFGAALPSVVDLEKGVTNTNNFGFKYGASEHRSVLITRFDGTSDALLSVTGFDIDSGSEVQVFVNGEAIGYLRKGPNNGLNRGDEFLLPASKLQSTNSVEFRQAKPGVKWGVTNLRIDNLNQPPISLTEGVLHTGEYGAGFGSNSHYVSLKATFNGGSSDLLLDAVGYDIDSKSEVKVLLNGKSVGFLKPTANNASGATQLGIPKSRQRSGTNTLEFRQLTPGYKWGVGHLKLTAVASPLVGLAPGVIDESVYGWKHGSNEHMLGVTAQFTGQGQDLLFTFQGYDVDNSAELRVYLNDMLIKKVPKGRNNAFDIRRKFLLPAQMQNQGAVNQLEIRQRKPGNKWAVRNLLIENISGPVVNLGVDTSVNSSFGWRYGSGEHKGVLRALFNQTGNDLTLEAVGYDIDSANEVAVYLNGERLGNLKAGADRKASPLTRFSIVASDQVAGTNVIEFRQRKPGNLWGLERIALNATTGPAASLSAGDTDIGAYGKGFGSDQHFNVLRSQFTGGSRDVLLGVIGFDMDSGLELEVLVNGESKGFLRKGKNNGYNEGNVFFLSAEEQINGTNQVEFRQLTPGNKWGVTYLQLETLDDDG